MPESLPQRIKTDFQGFEWTKFSNAARAECNRCNERPASWACNQNGLEYCARCLKERS